jgi:hypothetical protein
VLFGAFIVNIKISTNRLTRTSRKIRTHPTITAGLLHSLELPWAVWADVAMDFIEELSRVNDKTVLLTVIDQFSKAAHFILLSDPYMATMVACMFFDVVVHQHDIPNSIISYRDPVFTSSLWHELFPLFSVKLNLSSAFHP